MYTVSPAETREIALTEVQALAQEVPLLRPEAALSTYQVAALAQ